MMVKVEDDTAPPELSPVDGDDYYDDDEEEYDGTDTDSEGYGDGAARRRGGQSQLKKGPWTPEEDKRLADYVQAHGEGSWNQVRINAGLNRCGKSCRLRWSNHLRPDLKKVPLDAEEIEKIYRMHMAWGNKWAKMAAQLPGRTDNEIKNFWNTRLKRIQKSGLPIYPDHLHLQPSNQDMNFGTPEEPRGTKRPNEFLRDVLGISDLMHEYFNPTAFTKVFSDMSNPPHPSDVHPNSLLMDAKPLKLLKSSGCIAAVYSGSHSLVQIPDESEEAVCVTSFNYGMTDNQLAPFSNGVVSDYPIFDGNPSTSWTAQRPMKTELPSVQNSNYGLGDACVYDCPSGSFELADSLLESPGSPKSESISSHYSLDAILYKGDGIVDPTMSQVVFEPPFSCNQVPQSNAHSLWHFTSVPGDDEIEDYPHSEIQASKPPSSSDAILAENKCNPDTSFTGKNLPPLAGDSMFDASLEASGIFDSFIDGVSYEEGKLSAAGHALDWSSMLGACNMSDFPNL